MLSIEKNIIKYLRKETNCPYWSIVACLEINDWDIDKTINRLKDIYCVWGDNPSIQIKHDEDILREEYKQKCDMDREMFEICKAIGKNCGISANEVYKAIGSTINKLTKKEIKNYELKDILDEQKKRRLIQNE